MHAQTSDWKVDDDQQCPLQRVLRPLTASHPYGKGEQAFNVAIGSRLRWSCRPSSSTNPFISLVRSIRGRCFEKEADLERTGSDAAIGPFLEPMQTIQSLG